MEETKAAPPEGALSGQTVVVTRPREQARDLSERLRKEGARPFEAATIRIADPPQLAPLIRAVERLESYDWVVLTSVNGVRKLQEAFAAADREPSALADARLAAIGPATAGALEALGLRPEVVPGRYRAEALVRSIAAAAVSGPEPSAPPTGEEAASTPGRPLAGRRILLPRAAEARSVLPDGLRRAGAEVDEVAAYVTLPDPRDAERLRRVVTERKADWVTFTSSSTVRNYVRIVGARTGGARVATIGPITAATARRLGVPVDVVAEEYTVPGLVSALVRAVSAGEE